MADQVISLGTLFTGDARQAVQEVGKVRSALDQVNAVLDAITAKARSANITISSIGKALSGSGSATAAAAANLTEYDKALASISQRGKVFANAFTEVTKGLNRNSDAHKSAAKTVMDTEASISQLQKRYGEYLSNIQGMTRGTKAYEKEMSRLRGTTLLTSNTQLLTEASMARFGGTINNTLPALASWISQTKLGTPVMREFAASIAETTRASKSIMSQHGASQKAAAGYTEEARRALGVIQQQTAAANENAKAMGSVASVVSNVVGKIKNLAEYAVADTVVYSIANAFRSGVAEIINFDQALKNLQAISGDTEVAILAMGEVIRDVARTTKFSTTEIAEGMVLLAQAGLSSSEAFDSIQAVANLATGTLSNMQTSTDLMTTTLRAFNLDAKESGRISDVWANAINKSKLSIDKLRIAMGYIAVTASQANLSLEETAATMALLANNGLRASTIGTSFRQVLSRLLNPSQKLRDVLQAYGIQLEQLNPRIVGFEKSIANLASLMWDSEKAAVDMGEAFEFFGLRGAQAAAVIVQGFVTGEYQVAKKNMLEIGQAAKMAGIQAEGLGLKFKNLADRTKLVAIAVGDAGLAATLGLLADTLKVVATGIESFVKSDIGGLAATIGVITAQTYAFVVVLKKLGAISGASLAINKLSTSIRSFSTVAAAAGGAWTKFTGFLKNNAVFVAVAAITSLVSAIDYLIDRHRKAADAAGEMGVAHERATETITYYIAAISDLANSDAPTAMGDASRLVERFAAEFPELTELVLESADALDATSVKVEEFILALQRVRVDQFGERLEQNTERIREMSADLDGLKGRFDTQAPWLKWGTAWFPDDEIIKESQEKYEEAIRQMAKTFVDMSKAVSESQEKFNRVADSLDRFESGAEKLKFLMVVFGYTTSEADNFLQKLEEVPGATERMGGTVAAEIDRIRTQFGILLTEFKNVIEALPSAYRAALKSMGAIGVADFLDFQKNIDKKIAEHRRYAKLLGTSEADLIASIAVIRAREYATFAANNEKMLDSTKSREQAIVDLIQGFVDQAISEHDRGAISRQEAESMVTGYMQVINEKYLDDVRKTYDEASDIIEEHVKGLQASLKKAYSEINSINRSIEDENWGYLEDIRDVQQRVMSDEERWLDDRAEANRLLSEGIKTQNEDMVRDAQGLFKSLARNVKNENGEVVRSVEETVKIAEAGMTKAHDGVMSILGKKKKAFERDAKTIEEKINEAKKKLDDFRKKIDEVSNSKMTLDTDDAKKKIDELREMAEKLRKEIAGNSPTSSTTNLPPNTPRDGYAEGGRVTRGGNPQGIDTVPAMLTEDEFVQPQRVPRRYSFAFMEGLRRLKYPVENVKLVMKAGARKIQDILSPHKKISTKKFFDGGRVEFTPRPISVSDQIPSMVDQIISKGYNQSVGQQVAGLSLDDMQSFGRFEIVGHGGVKIQAVAAKDPLQAFKEAYERERMRRRN